LKFVVLVKGLRVKRFHSCIVFWNQDFKVLRS
jgi:hypothetical protein